MTVEQALALRPGDVVHQRHPSYKAYNVKMVGPIRKSPQGDYVVIGVTRVQSFEMQPFLNSNLEPGYGDQSSQS